LTKWLAMAAPETIVLERDRDLQGRQTGLWVRRALMGLIALVPVVALLNVFGQQPDTSRAMVSKATLSVYSPTHLRGGLLYEARFHITAHEQIKDARLVLGPGWLEGMTVNTIEPSPVGEASQNGKLALDLGHVPADQSYILFMQFQVNPTNVGRRSRSVELYDGDTRLASLNQKVTVFP
jgi:hypothetical protein